MKRFKIAILVIGLFAFSAAVIFYRVTWLGYPLFPTSIGEAWEISVHAYVKNNKRDVKFILGIPSETSDKKLVEERVSSSRLNLSIITEGNNRFGIWSGDNIPPGEEQIIYRTTIFLNKKQFKSNTKIFEIKPVAVDSAEFAIAKRITAGLMRLPVYERIQALARTTVNKWAVPPPDRQDIEAWTAIQKKYGQHDAMLVLFNAANLPAQKNEGLILTEGVTKEPVKWIQVWNEMKWVNVSVNTGDIYPDNIILIPLVTGNIPVAKISGGELTDISWLVTRQIVNKWNIHFERITGSSSLIDRWSLFHLPPDFQETFRILILVPVGALIISILRNIIGFPTFGIFMPVLIALAFRSTGLAFGIGIFTGVTLLGYVIRKYIDRLHLLLVPRMSIILTIVIACFVGLALVGNKLGIKEFMVVGLLPFVILTMTVERFFIIIEESGIFEAFSTATGSVIVAVLAYEVISFVPLQLVFFVCPELLASVSAVQILIGRYTGYRLSELIRFRVFKNKL